MLKREEATECILARAGEDLLITLPVPQPGGETGVLEEEVDCEGTQLTLTGVQVLRKLEHDRLTRPTQPHPIPGHWIPQLV